MELTIKQLAAYLPYGLKCKIEVFSDNGTIVGLEGLNHNKVELSGVRKTVTEYFEYKEIRPILYPLDYLTKEITHNGETFVPIEVLNHKFRPFSKDINIFQYINGNFEIEIQTQEYSQSIDLFDGYKIVQMLLEWHFDIFALIKNNLAIAVTEDFNPYKL